MTRRRRTTGTALVAALLLTAGACSDAPDVPEPYLQPEDLEEAGLDVDEVEPGGPFVAMTSCATPDEHVGLRGGGAWVGYRVTTSGAEEGGQLRSGAWQSSGDELDALFDFLGRSPQDCPSSFPVSLDEAGAGEVASAVGVPEQDVRVVRRADEDEGSQRWRAYVREDEQLVVVDLSGRQLVGAVDPVPLVSAALERERAFDGDLAGAADA